ncbi:hypothetical protein K504DRAFT_537404 [Pleomassaria siparia CBS 279.74]|uniref:Uncharacterized protein n=1 Tax=Pleomassaria siparia CBS 279.74 TaxID=1314801 RepID=A0A6G1JXK3_9PLEO|nr:hypothetical protein K504DRAFT_537404 [Pleomassaria siparia CBS 279.74]
MTGLEELNDDILFIVFQYLRREYSSILQDLRLVSWRLKDFAESQIYKDVIVGDDEDDIDVTNRFIERLTNSRDTLSRHVRNFTVASFEGDSSSSCLNTDLMVNLMQGFQGLTSFSWNVDTPMPRAVLDAFHTYHPNTRLCVKTKTFDPTLLSSPQLYYLDISVACQNRFSSDTLSLFRRLKNILVQNRSMRVLVLDIHNDPYFRKLSLSQEDRGPLQFPFEPGDIMPPLEELTIKAREYVFDKDHFQQWLHCMDWKKLRGLSFGLQHPTNLFASLINQTPKLHSLGFGYTGITWRPVPSPFNPGTHQSLNEEMVAPRQFISSIEGLKELIARFQTVHLDHPIWKDIAEKHGSSLRCLAIREWNVYMANNRGLSQLHLLSLYFPSLRQLDIDMELKQLSNPVNPTSQICSLASLTCLQHIKISIQSNDDRGRALVDGEDSSFPRCLLTHLWNAFFDFDSASELISITLRFWQWQQNLMLRHDPNHGRIKQMFYTGIKPNHELNMFVHKKSDHGSLYGAKFTDCDGIM